MESIFLQQFPAARNDEEKQKIDQLREAVRSGIDVRVSTPTEADAVNRFLSNRERCGKV